jgi:hypothetical protein
MSGVVARLDGFVRFTMSGVVARLDGFVRFAMSGVVARLDGFERLAMSGVVARLEGLERLSTSGVRARLEGLERLSTSGVRARLDGLERFSTSGVRARLDGLERFSMSSGEGARLEGLSCGSRLSTGVGYSRFPGFLEGFSRFATVGKGPSVSSQVRFGENKKSSDVLSVKERLLGGRGGMPRAKRFAFVSRFSRAWLSTGARHPRKATARKTSVNFCIPAEFSGSREKRERLRGGRGGEGEKG